MKMREDKNYSPLHLERIMASSHKPKPDFIIKRPSREQRTGRLFKDLNYAVDDPEILRAIVTYGLESIKSGDLEQLTPFLYDDGRWFLGDIECLFYPDVFPLSEQGYAPLDKFLKLPAEYIPDVTVFWELKCRILYRIAETTREHDDMLQYFINYEDWLTYIVACDFGRQFIVNLYDLRGIDFFLRFFYAEEKTTTPFLFENAQLISVALTALGRSADAQQVKAEIDRRKTQWTGFVKSSSSLANIETKTLLVNFSEGVMGGIASAPIIPSFTSVLRKILPSKTTKEPPPQKIQKSLTQSFGPQELRARGKQFWHSYLGGSLWSALTLSSQEMLSNAFVKEALTKQSILSSWSDVVLTLCQVIELETNRALTEQWKDFFKDSTFTLIETTSKKQQRRVAQREKTHQLLVKTTNGERHAPTLGELRFIVAYWNDDLMDQCTNTFARIRSKNENYGKQIKALSAMLNEPIGRTDADIIELRNLAAHPRPYEDIDWTHSTKAVKTMLGKPPVQILKLLVLDLKRF